MYPNVFPVSGAFNNFRVLQGFYKGLSVWGSGSRAYGFVWGLTVCSCRVRISGVGFAAVCQGGGIISLCLFLFGASSFPFLVSKQASEHGFKKFNQPPSPSEAKGSRNGIKRLIGTYKE